MLKPVGGSVYNNRRHTRFSLSKNILVKSSYLPIDLSESGMQLETDRNLKVGTTVSLALDIGSEILNINGEIRWCRPAASIFGTQLGISFSDTPIFGQKFRFGVVFVNITVFTQLKLRDFIRDASNEKPTEELTGFRARQHIRYQVQENMVLNPEFKADNLSESGAALRSPLDHKVGEVVNIVLALDNETLTVPSEIVWCERSNQIFGSDQYRVGVMFLGPTLYNQIQIRNFLRNSGAQPVSENQT